MKSFGPKSFQILCSDQKVPFWQFFRKGRDGCALIVRPLRIPHRNSKIVFALGANEFLVMLEGKIRETLSFKVQPGKITVCIVTLFSNIIMQFVWYEKIEVLKLCSTRFNDPTGLGTLPA